MINILGTTKVTKLEVKENYTNGVVYESYKNKNDEYETEFVNCVFVGAAHKKICTYPNKTKFTILKGMFRMEKNKYPKLVIIDIHIEDEVETPFK